MALAPGISAAAVMAYIETLNSFIKTASMMAYVETLDSTIKVATLGAYIEVEVADETLRVTKAGLMVELEGDETVYITKTGLMVEHWAGAWSSVPDDPTNLVAVVV